MENKLNINFNKKSIHEKFENWFVSYSKVNVNKVVNFEINHIEFEVIYELENLTDKEYNRIVTFLLSII